MWHDEEWSLEGRSRRMDGSCPNTKLLKEGCVRFALYRAGQRLSLSIFRVLNFNTASGKQRESERERERAGAGRTLVFPTWYRERERLVFDQPFTVLQGSKWETLQPLDNTSSELPRQGETAAKGGGNLVVNV